MTLTTQMVYDEAEWFRLDEFAHKISRGRWVPYRWLVEVCEIIRPLILKRNARIIIEAPPRHGKSELISHWLPTWYLEWFPEDNVILTSYGDNYAKDWGSKVRDEFLSGEKTWTRVRYDKSNAANWSTKEGGGMRSAGVGGAITGRGAHLIIVDDPHKDWSEAMSATHRERVISWFKSTLYSRREPDASIIVCQTRWHENDLSGFLKNEHADDWTVISLSAIAEDDDFLKRNPGEPLCPERFNAIQLEQIRESIGTFIWNALYQQRPAPLEGGIIKRAWFKRYSELPERFETMLQSWDLSFKETGSSFVVCEVWGKIGSKFFLVDVLREKIDFPTTLKKMIMMSERWPNAIDKLIEDKANGPAVISTLNDTVPGIIPYSPKGNKETRLAAISGMIEAGNVYIPESNIALWADTFLEEVVTFPNATNDDQVDAMTQALDRMSVSAFDLNFNIPNVGVRTNPWEEINARH